MLYGANVVVCPKEWEIERKKIRLFVFEYKIQNLSKNCSFVLLFCFFGLINPILMTDIVIDRLFMNCIYLDEIIRVEKLMVYE